MMDYSEALKLVKSEFGEKVTADKEIQTFLKLVQNKSYKANFESVRYYAQRLGEILGDVLHDNLSTFSDIEFAEAYEAIIPSMLTQNHDLVQVAGKEIQKILDEKDGISLGAVDVKVNKSKVNGIVKTLTDEVMTVEKALSKINSLVTNFTESSFDEFIKSNVAFRFDIGMDPQIIRIYEGGHWEHTGRGSDRHKKTKLVDCQWCKNLAGIYDYKNIPDDVFKRHEGCHCTVIYKNHKEGYLQNAHTKRNY